MGSGGDTGLPPNQVYYCGRKMGQCRCGRCQTGICGPSSGCPCDSCKLMCVDAMDVRGSNGQSQGQFSDLIAFAKAVSLDTLTAMVSIDSDHNIFPRVNEADSNADATSNREIDDSGHYNSAADSGENSMNLQHLADQGYDNVISYSADSHDDSNPHPMVEDSLTPLGPSPANSSNQLKPQSPADGKPPLHRSRSRTASAQGLADGSTDNDKSPEKDSDVVIVDSHEAASVYSSLFSYVSKFFSSSKSSAAPSPTSGHPSGVNTINDNSNHRGRPKTLSNATLALTSTAPAPASAPDSKLSPDLHFELCCICMDQFRDCTIVHARTGHVCCCYDCALLLKQNGGVCPTCKAPIQMVVKYFFPPQTKEPPSPKRSAETNSTNSAANSVSNSMANSAANSVSNSKANSATNSPRTSESR
jgi:hypothetical protein